MTAGHVRCWGCRDQGVDDAAEESGQEERRRCRPAGEEYGRRCRNRAGSSPALLMRTCGRSGRGVVVAASSFWRRQVPAVPAAASAAAATGRVARGIGAPWPGKSKRGRWERRRGEQGEVLGRQFIYHRLLMRRRERGRGEQVTDGARKISWRRRCAGPSHQTTT